MQEEFSKLAISCYSFWENHINIYQLLSILTGYQYNTSTINCLIWHILLYFSILKQWSGIFSVLTESIVTSANVLNYVLGTGMYMYILYMCWYSIIIVIRRVMLCLLLPTLYLPYCLAGYNIYLHIFYCFYSIILFRTQQYWKQQPTKHFTKWNVYRWWRQHSLFNMKSIFHRKYKCGKGRSTTLL